MTRLETLTFIALTSAFLLTGCGNPYGGDFSLVDPNHGGSGSLPTPSLPIANGTEFVSSSQQNALSSNGTHRIYASIGSPTDAVVQTTALGRHLFSGVQGEILSSQTGF